MRHFTVRHLLFVVLSLLALDLTAQQKPRENAEVLVALRVAGQGVPTGGQLYFRLAEAGQPDTLNTAFPGAGSGALTQSGPLYALMKPNRHYQAWVSADPWQHGEVKFSPPPGYSLWINDRPATTFRVSGNPFLIYKIELRADSGGAFLPAGQALPPQVGDLVWTISAGRYSTGLSAGTIQWRAPALTPALLEATALSYLEPATSEVAVTRHSDGGLLELDTFQAILHVRRNPTPGTGYDIEVYNPTAVRTGTGDGPYTYNEAPYRTYRISNPNGATWAGRIKIEKIEGTATESWDLTHTGANWTIVETSALRTITRVSTPNGPNREETVEVRDDAGAVATKLRRVYQNFPWGQEEMVSETANPDALNGPPLTTTYAYGTAWGTGGYGRLQSVTNPDGSWSRYDYDDTFAGFGNPAAVYRPWQDGPADPASATPANSQALLFSHAGERDLFLDLPAGTETRTLGITTAKNTVSYAFPGNAPNGQPLRAETLTTYTAAAATLVTTRQLYNPTAASADYLGRLHAQTAPDGARLAALRYQAYWWNYGDNNATLLKKHPTPSANTTWGEYRFYGFSTPVAGSVPVNNWDGQGFETVYLVPNRSLVELDIFNAEGRVWHRTRYVFTGAAGGAPTFEFLAQEETGYANGVRTLQHALTGVRDQWWLVNGRLSGRQTNDGGYGGYGYDALGRPVLESRDGFAGAGEYPAQGAIYTHRSYDAASRVVRETLTPSVTAAPTPEAVTTTRAYNQAGLPVSETAESGAGNFTTTYAYADGGRTVTATLPGGATRITTRWRDGSLKSVTGTAVVSEHHQTTVNADGTLTAATYTLRGADLATPTAAPRWVKLTTDWAGRAIREERPAPPGATPAVFTRQSAYNGAGQLVRTTETGLADTLVAYNAWQQPHRTGLDLNATGALEPASSDRLTETDTLFEKDGAGAWWMKTTTLAYHVDGSATPVTTGTSRTRLNKYSDHGRLFAGYTQLETVTTDVLGNPTRRTVEVQRGSSYFANDLRLTTETVDHPDSSADEVTVARNGLLQKRQSRENLVTRFYYDARGRLVKQTDPRADPSATPRVGFVANSDRVAWRQDGAGNQTGYAYQSNTGRLAIETNPLGKATYYDYTARGEVNWTWGPATYPVAYEYSDYGERALLRTYRDPTVDWNTGTLPANRGTGDVTTWAYDPASGSLTGKTDAAGRTVTYTHTARGQLATRTWARGVTTTYAYSATTAEQTAITYSDGTPALGYTYNRLGQSATVGDATGSRSFAYSPATAQLTSETLPSYFGGRVLSRSYDTSTAGALGRLTGYTLAGSTTEQQLTYGFDTTGRFNSVSLAGTAITYTYGYTPNSNLIASVTDTASGWTQTRTYLANRDLLDVIETKVSTTTKAKFDYAHDALGRRTAVAKTGEMFARYSSAGLDTTWGYNDRSEVTLEQSKLGGTATVLAGRDDAYAFDAIGNRTTATHNGTGAAYTTNSLNQYTQRAVPGTVDVSGLAPSAATVSVNASSSGVTRQGDWFFKGYGVTNTSPLWQSITASSSLGGSDTRNAFVAATPEAMTYDLDGNLLSDGRWDYTYDAENRLVAMQTRAAVIGPIPNADARRLEFVYDYLGRRVRKLVRAGYNGTTYTTVVTDLKFIYDGWNLIAEYGALSTLTLTRAHIWGLDWSGTMQGAGGVGGLLMVRDITGGFGYQPLFDGNGNVMGLSKRVDGSLAAVYEYDAFGQTLRETGAFAAGNPFRFSTKYTDIESGLVYYGFRYYSPSLGRFVCRDPKEEDGGRNLYAFLQNDAINAYDYLGMIEGDQKTPDAFSSRAPSRNPYGYGRVTTIVLASQGTPSIAGSFGSWASFAGGQTATLNPNGTNDLTLVREPGGSTTLYSTNLATGNTTDYGSVNLTGSVGTGAFTISSLDRSDTGYLYAAQDQFTGQWGNFGGSVGAPNSAGIDLRTPQQRAADESYAREVAAGRNASGQLAFGTALNQVVNENGVIQLSVSGGFIFGGTLSVTWNPGQTLSFRAGVGAGLGLGVSLGVGVAGDQSNPNYPGYVDPPAISFSASGGLVFGGELSGSVSADPYRSLSGSVVVGLGFGLGGAITFDRGITFDTNKTKQKPFDPDP